MGTTNRKSEGIKYKGHTIKAYEDGVAMMAGELPAIRFETVKKAKDYIDILCKYKKGA